MLLRLSGVAGENFAEAAGNVPDQNLLERFVMKVLGEDSQELNEARETLSRTLGWEAVVDTAAVIAQFEAVNRIADATGLQLDDMLEQAVMAGLAKPDLPVSKN